jgi:hypothetical protein
VDDSPRRDCTTGPRREDGSLSRSGLAIPLTHRTTSRYPGTPAPPMCRSRAGTHHEGRAFRELLLGTVTAGGINRHSLVAQAAPPDLPCGWGQLRENWAVYWVGGKGREEGRGRLDVSHLPALLRGIGRQILPRCRRKSERGARSASSTSASPASGDDGIAGPEVRPRHKARLRVLPARPPRVTI